MKVNKNIKIILNLLESRIGIVYKFLEKNFVLNLVLLFLLSLAVRLYFTPFGFVLREDAYAYLLKSLEITKGNFIPVHTHAIGWPLFMSPFLYFFGSNSLFQNMAYARIISIFIAAITIFPLAYLGKKLLGNKNLFALLVLFAFAPPLVSTSTSALTEPLFILLFLLSICFIIKARDNINYILLSSLVGAFAYYVRFNGILILAVIILSFLLLKKQIKNFSYRYIFFAILIFFGVSAPVLYQRYYYFGSPFDYGSLNKYFVDSRQEVWSENIKGPSLAEYLRTHTFSQILDKFLVHGFFGVVYDYFFYVVPPLILFFFLYGAIAKFDDLKFAPLYLALAFSVGSLMPLYHVMTVPRYLYPTIPLVLIFASIALHDFFQNTRYKNISLALFLTIFIVFSASHLSQLKESQQFSFNDLDWARWSAKNIKGRIAIIEGGDLIMMNLPDTVIGGVELHRLSAPQSNLSIIRPGYFKNLSSAMEWFKNSGVTHLAIDYRIDIRPYLKDIYTEGKVQTYLTQVYSNEDSPSKWKMKIYYIDWAKYSKT